MDFDEEDMEQTIKNRRAATPSTPIDKEDDLFETDNDEIRDWFVNLIFSGKTIAAINKMPKAELDRLDYQFKVLEKLINSHLRSILDEEQVQRAYMESLVMSDFPNQMRVLTESLNKEISSKYLSGKETK